MMLQGPTAYTLVKVESGAGLFGIGEAYGSPGVGVKAGIVALKPDLIRKDPLGIDVLMTGLGWDHEPHGRQIKTPSRTASLRFLDWERVASMMAVDHMNLEFQGSRIRIPQQTLKRK